MFFQSIGCGSLWQPDSLFGSSPGAADGCTFASGPAGRSNRASTSEPPPEPFPIDQLFFFSEEASNFGDESCPGRVAFEQQMVPALKRDEARAGDLGGEPAARLERHYCIVAAVQYQAWDSHLRQKIDDVYLAQLGEKSGRVLGRRSDTLQVVEPMP